MQKISLRGYVIRDVTSDSDKRMAGYVCDVGYEMLLLIGLISLSNLDLRLVEDIFDFGINVNISAL